ncbi:1-aminocyclopropane-1-carboxylate synthase, putative [Perkinsus marinus ATCC 50983]|uniref:1-aminocyclopropane-1-carboxylate synthase, putative n=1 Tax=Perkinsus marinus (strain ATCC 50983 / TXsc) TaxID=423536 RepID=C5LIF8_PERM5|nr:1-aminocyclopropane-1-carboxylate synthase, putative [Perkinsus marinus ATCC 50983]EER03361.1 1-aminocyclopropane-1-carboxylate synthase, putative [Perkinsus marinus ATCC 50983]|eukprot:XP_002771545.1 1-aminocyclopropane-1-carboxylate synthase, putative [Perkinsus marinus ATCC 50983]
MVEQRLDDSVRAKPPYRISRRGKKAAATEFTVYAAAFADAQKDLYDKDTNPEGFIPMCMAENRTMGGDVEKKFRKTLAELAADPAFPRHQLCDYGDSSGMHNFKQAVSRAVSTHLASPEVAVKAMEEVTDQYVMSEQKMQAEDILCITNGCGSAMNMVSFCLGDGDGKDCFITTYPAYPVFATDCGLEANIPVKFVVKTTEEDGFRINLKTLDSAYKQCVSEGYRPRALITTDPGNPMGSVASVEELRALRNWCGLNGLWWISDEIYGCSVHNDCNRPHISALSLPLLEGDIDPPTLVLWGFSKDMALSGMRVGFIMNVPRQRNWELIEAIRHAAAKQYGIFSMVSPVAQEVCTRMLSDDEWLPRFLQTSRDHLTACKRILCDGLAKLNIPYFEPHAGLFLWCDLTEFLKSDDSDGLGLFNTLKSDPYKMVISPGSCFFADKPGMMRLCYAWMTDGQEACREVIRRLSHLAQESRKGEC